MRNNVVAAACGIPFVQTISASFSMRANLAHMLTAS